MTTSLPDGQLAALSRFVAATLGLNFPPARWGDLERQVTAAADEFGFGGLATFLPWLLSAPLSPQQIELLASHLTICETYFWREPQIFEALRRHILPDLIRERATGSRRLRIWSAGCASGEEAYSLAILLRELIPAPEDWRITLLATDINPRMLRRAALGVYDEWSFRNAPPRLKEKYFHQRDDGQFELAPNIRKMVTFAYLNLAGDSYPSLMNHTNSMDLIFCRNVLMYFSPEQAPPARQRLFKSLAIGGWLAVSASELNPEKYAQFTPVSFPGVFVYRRESAASPAAAVMPANPIAAQPILPPPPLPAVSLPVPAPHWPSAISPARVTLVTQHDQPPGPNLAAVARHLASQGKLSEALAVCNEALAASRLDPGLHYLHAVILQEQKQDDEAKAALKRALYLDPRFVLAHIALGSLSQRQGQARVAQKSFQNALALLEAVGPDDILPEAEGLTAGRLMEFMRGALQQGALIG